MGYVILSFWNTDFYNKLGQEAKRLWEGLLYQCFAALPARENAFSVILLETPIRLRTMSRSIPYTFTCACGESFTAPVYESVNVTLEPQLLYIMLAGLLNVATCPNCGRRAALARPFLYHDMARGLFAYVHPRADLPEERRAQVLEQLQRAYSVAVEESARLQEPPPGSDVDTIVDDALDPALQGGEQSDDAPPLRVIFGVDQLCALVNTLLSQEERLGKLALSSKSQRPEERQRLRAIAQEMASQIDCQVEVDDAPGEYTVWLYGPRRAIGAIMRELAPRQ
jgi:hypothetical protein